MSLSAREHSIPKKGTTFKDLMPRGRRKGGDGTTSKRNRLTNALLVLMVSCASLISYALYRRRGSAWGAAGGEEHQGVGVLEKGRSTQRSAFRCERQADWLDICAYEMMCFDGRKLVLIDDAVTEKTPFEAKHPALDSVNWEPNPAPPPFPHQGSPLPFEAKAGGYYLPAFDVRWEGRETHSATTHTVQRLEGTLWLVAPESPDARDPWHFLISIMPIWTLQFINQTGREHPFPSIDNVVIMEPIHNKNAYNLRMLNWIIQPHTNVYWNEDISVNGNFIADPNKSPPDPETKVRPLPPPLDIPENGLVCAERGFMAGYKYPIFSGPAEALEFRKKVFGLCNLPLGQPPKFVLIVDRGVNGRAFQNPQEIVRIVDEVLHLPYRYVRDLDSLSVDELIALFHGAGLSIHPHGEGLTNIIFQQPKSAVIEVFPYLHHVSTFSQLAMSTRVIHFPIHTYIKGNSVKYHSIEEEERCKLVNVYGLGRDSSCLHPLLGSRVSPPSDLLELTIVSAMRAIGYPIYPSSKLQSRLESMTNLETTIVTTARKDS